MASVSARPRSFSLPAGPLARALAAVSSRGPRSRGISNKYIVRLAPHVVSPLSEEFWSQCKLSLQLMRETKRTRIGITFKVKRHLFPVKRWSPAATQRRRPICRDRWYPT